MSKLKHPNIIAYKESFLCDADKTLCIVTAYAEEGDLFTHIRNAQRDERHFPERQLLDWTAQIALALDHIHRSRVLHRDLKTQNIFLGRGGVVKLGDFGISRVLERTDDFATTVTGTPYYMAPEVCTSQPYTLKSDVWSFGCVAYEIATLRHAFAADSLLSLVYQIVNGTCPPIPEEAGYDPRFAAMVAGLLDRDASRRPTISQVLQTPLMQQHLRRMQEEGLGRTSVGGGGGGGGRNVVGGNKNKKPPPPPPGGMVPMTPRERMAERRRLAAEEREAELRAAAEGNAAAAQKNLARERYQLEFYSRATAETGAGTTAAAAAAAENEKGKESDDSHHDYENSASEANTVKHDDDTINAAAAAAAADAGTRMMTTTMSDVSLPGGGGTLSTATMNRLRGHGLSLLDEEEVHRTFIEEEGRGRGGGESGSGRGGGEVRGGIDTHGVQVHYEQTVRGGGHGEDVSSPATPSTANSLAGAHSLFTRPFGFIRST